MGDVVELRPVAPDGGPPIPPRPPKQPTDAAGRLLYDGPEHARWLAALRKWQPTWDRRRKWEEKQAAKARAEKRAAAPHPNWHNRLPRCHVAIIGPTPPPVSPPFARKAKTPRPPPVAHHGAWEGDPLRCGQRVVAYDTTDTRAVGYLYGACVHHLEGALTADPSRSWLWAADARPVVPADVEAELALAVLGGMRQ